MPSVVDICNMALDKLGQSPITSLADGNKAANLCDRNWPLIRDQMIRSHPWNFAMTRATLAPSSTSPDWGFVYQFPLPSDNLRLVEILDHRADEYQKEGSYILADEDTLYIRYLRREEDPTQYDDLFIEVVACKLAIQLCEPMSQSATKKRELKLELKDALIAAGMVDGQENPVAQFEEDDWISVRY